MDNRSDSQSLESQQRTRSIESRARDILQYGSSGVGLLALVLYAAVRIAYNAFYAKFGVRPEEVGITYVSIVVPVAEIAFLVGFVVLGFVAQTAWWPGGRSAIQHLWNRPSARMAMGGAIWFGASASLALVDKIYPAESNHSFPWSAGEWAVAAVGLLYLSVGFGRLLTAERRPDFVPNDSGYTVGNLVLVTGVFIGMLATLAYLFAYAEFTAEGVVAGRGVQPSPISFVSFQASPVCVSWIGPDQPPSLDLSNRMFYLGTADGIVVLYRRSHSSQSAKSLQAPVRVPMSKVVLLPAPENSPCV